MALISGSPFDRGFKHPNKTDTKEMSGKWEHGLEQEHQRGSERRHVFVLCCAVVITLTHEEILLSGKDHGIKLPPSAEADLLWRAGTESELTACYVSHTQTQDMALCPYYFSHLNVDI